MTVRQKRALSFLFTVVAVFLGSIETSAQTSPSPRGARETLADFQQFARTRRGTSPDEVRHPERYAPARVDSVLAGLEQIALTADPRFIGSSAAASLARAGSVQNAPPGVFDRQVRVYVKSNSPIVRLRILNAMFEQRDRVRSLAFLKAVAAQRTDQQDFQDAAVTAVEGLSRMGAAGRAALIDMRDRNTLRDGKAIGFVNWFLGTQ